MEPNIFFNKRQNNAQVFVKKKTEKICAALFLVTDAVVNDDLFRTTVRSKGLALLEPDTFSQLSTHLEAIVSLCTMARWGNIISEMNTRILIEECAKLVEFIATHEEALQSTGLLSLELFDTPVEEQAIFDKRQISDTLTNTVQHTASPQPQDYSKRQQSSTADKGHQKEENKEKQRDRRAMILSVLQKKDRISVKDVAQVITDCSEKTLQRELLGLVAQGVLKKEGERRWSTYSLAGKTVN